MEQNPYKSPEEVEDAAEATPVDEVWPRWRKLRHIGSLMFGGALLAMFIFRRLEYYGGPFSPRLYQVVALPGAIGAICVIASFLWACGDSMYRMFHRNEYH